MYTSVISRVQRCILFKATTDSGFFLRLQYEIVCDIWGPLRDLALSGPCFLIQDERN